MQGVLTKTAIVLGLLAVAPALAQAETWQPTRSIKMICPFPAGGGTDLIARLAAKGLSERLGQQVYVENRGGANGAIGVQQLMQADPDGYTIGAISDGPMIVNPALYPNNPYQPLRDFIGVGQLIKFPSMLVANAGTGIKTVADMIKAAKDKPGALNFSSGGIGNFSHMGLELLAIQAGIKLTHVPYRGVGPAVNDAIGGHVQLAFAGLGAVRSGVESGALKILAVAQSQRLKSAPQYPTSAEAGLPGYEFVTWFGVVAPKGTPAPIIATLVKQIHAMQDDPSVQHKLAAGGLEPLKETPEQFGARMRRDQDRFRDVVKAAKLKPE